MAPLKWDVGECSIISLHMCTYWIILILTLISTLNVPICKFKYQSISDHYTYHYVWSLCRSPPGWSLCKLPSVWSSCKYYTAVKVIMLWSSCIIQNMLNIKRNPHVKCISHCICHSIVKLLYIGKEKRGIVRTWNWRTKMHSTMHYHYAHWTVCMYVLWLVTINC